MTSRDWLRSAAGGDRRALARAITALENREPEAREALAQLGSGHGVVIGVTGAPGAGKSTLVNQLAKEYRRSDRSVAILAVDPSSEVTGGAILGDRIRMQDLIGDRGVFVRSMASRGAHGGLAEGAADVIRLFRATGRDVVLVETVGVGQSEVDIARLADITVVLLVPGMGDDIQALKAGIMEIADVFVISKADRPGVEQLEQEIRGAMDGGIPILRTIAADGTGVADLAAAIAAAAARKKEKQG